MVAVELVVSAKRGQSFVLKFITLSVVAMALHTLTNAMRGAQVSVSIMLENVHGKQGAFFQLIAFAAVTFGAPFHVVRHRQLVYSLRLRLYESMPF